jgi:formate C-acetyltransferase
MSTQIAEKPAQLGAASWRGFNTGLWMKEINLRAFIQRHVTPYYGDGSFLAGPTPRTTALLTKLQAMFVEERKKGVLAVSQVPTSITAHDAGYIDKASEIIVGLQTDAPLKRAIMPNGGLRMVVTALEAFGFKPDPVVVEIFTKYRKTHNDGVFDAYTNDVRRCRSSHILTGLPDAYGRGRIVGDYRRVALYGVDRLIEVKKAEKVALDAEASTDAIIRDREELSEQARALGELKEMAAKYGFDISGPASTAREAVQWLYFGYLAGVKEQNGAAMSLGRVSTFLDIYFERDMQAGLLTEEQAQEIVDDFVIKLRIVRFLRTPEYNELYAGDPTWVTESIGGMGDDGRPLVTKTSFRFLQTLYNLGPAPEPNLTIWYSPRLPEPFRRFVAKVAIDTSSIQFENDDTMRGAWGDDGAIACCVSPMALGKQMQFFGARANLAKCMLYAINGGRDEVSGKQVGPVLPPLTGEVLDFEEVVERFNTMMDWLAGVYVSAMNAIHYMHDKYAYERIEMALHDYSPLRTMAFGIAGMSVVADSLSAIRYARVKPIRNETGLVVDYRTEGEFPLFGNNDNRVDQIAAWLVSTFMKKLRRHPTYRNALHTQSVLTITSNVVYGKATGNTPDGRRPTRCTGATAMASTPRPLRSRRSPTVTRPTASR